jgi:FlaA1/EpsC-like NDP-sugar epimerase
MRPGEKLHERLFYESEAVEPTDHPKIQRVAQKAVTTSPRTVAESLLRRVEAGDELGLRRQLMEYVREVEPSAARPFYVKPASGPSVTRGGRRPPSGVHPDVAS